MLKEFGLKVSTLYISQVKRKYGIKVGEHYNISQKENQKVPQCPITAFAANDNLCKAVVAAVGALFAIGTGFDHSPAYQLFLHP